MDSLLAELKRRKVFRVAAVYAVVAWLLIQVADVVLPALQLPAWTVTFITVLFILGFPIAVVLAWAYESTPEGIRPDHEVQASPGRRATSAQPINYLILLIVLAMAGVQVGDRWFSDNTIPTVSPTASSSSENVAIRSHIDLGDELNLIELPGKPTTFFDFAPDGRSFYYLSHYAGRDGSRLYRRYLDRLEPELILTSDISFHEFRISPDGSRVAFASGPFPSELFLMNLSGGTPIRVVDSIRSNAFAWLDEDTLIYSDLFEGVIAYSVVDRSPRTLVEQNTGLEGVYITAFSELPGTEFALATVPRSLENAESSVIVLELSSGQQQTLVSNAYSPSYSPSGHLLFARNGDLWAAPFDPDRLQITGSARLLIESVESLEYGAGLASYRLSNEGLLLYQQGTQLDVRGEKSLVWLNRDGSERPLDLPAAQYEDPVLSPDGQRLAVTVYTGGAADIWTHRFSQPGILNRITRTGDATDPIWTPDGRYLLFSQGGQMELGGGDGIGQIDADGLGLVEPFLVSEGIIMPRDMAAGGTLIYVSNDGDDMGQGIYRYDTDNRDLPVQGLLTTEFNEYGPAISPDGRWLAYTSDETGDHEIYVRPYPDVQSGRWRISIDGGIEPKWGREANVLHYLTSDRNSLITARLQFEPGVDVLERQSLDIQEIATSGVPLYGVSASDDEFLIMRPANEDDEFQGSEDFPENLAVIVEDFFAELTQKVPPDEP